MIDQSTWISFYPSADYVKWILSINNVGSCGLSESIIDGIKLILSGSRLSDKLKDLLRDIYDELISGKVEDPVIKSGEQLELF